MIGIVGGGVSGLFLGHELMRYGMDVTIWESTNRLGGVVWSGDHQGLVLEKGPQRMRMTSEIRGLIEEVGLEEEVVTSSKNLRLLVYARGKLRKAPLTTRQFFSSDLLPFSSKLRFLGEILTSGVKENETVGNFLRRKFGLIAFESFLGPLYGGLYGSDPDRMLVESSLEENLVEAGIGRSIVLGALGRIGVRDNSPPCSFQNGLEALPNALGKRLGESIHLNSSVQTIERSKRKWRVILDDGNESSVDAVVLACPAEQAGGIVKGEFPQLANVWQQMHYNELALCHMQSEGVMEGLGYQVGFGETLETRGVTFNHSMFGRKGLYTAFLGGMRNPLLVDLSDEEISSIAT
ncbi:uncharacterized protein METZ01_LOCUS161385, partial [marine metagenome]